jgi:hypothetical protein
MSKMFFLSIKQFNKIPKHFYKYHIVFPLRQAWNPVLSDVFHKNNHVK